ncbi:MAG: aldo/keto reductase [Deinococcales bacterium]
MIPKAPFGSTGHDSTRTLFGAAALSDVSQGDADRTMELILDHGLNHIDVAASYGDAELRIGPWMEKHRGEFFLASKTGERSYQAARDEIRRSLERLRTDRLDLIQLHNLAEDDEWEVAMGEDGALRACVEARDEGLVRFIGVTGHGLGIAATHLKSLERFPFDSVLFPYSYVLLRDARYRADVDRLLAVCRERGVAIQTIKSLTRRP